MTPKYTAEQKHKELRREIAFRARVYPREIAKQRMTQREANERIEIMREIAEEYHDKAVANKERLL
jgi:hypothetical protein